MKIVSDSLTHIKNRVKSGELPFSPTKSVCGELKKISRVYREGKGLSYYYDIVIFVVFDVFVYGENHLCCFSLQ